MERIRLRRPRRDGTLGNAIGSVLVALSELSDSVPVNGRSVEGEECKLTSLTAIERVKETGMVQYVGWDDMRGGRPRNRI